MRLSRSICFACALLAFPACDAPDPEPSDHGQTELDPDFEPDEAPACGDAESLWVEVRDGGASFVDGGTLDFACGGQGGMMLVFDAEFGGVGLETQVNLTVDVAGMTGEPLYQGSHPVALSCEGSPAMLEIVAIVPDHVDAWSLDGNAMTLRFDVPLGNGETATREVSGYLGASGC